MRHRIDEGGINPRVNAIGKKHYNIEVIRSDFNCVKCNHKKSFYKRIGYVCCKCGNVQNIKRGV